MEHARSSYRILGEDDVGSEASGIRPMQVSDDGAGPRTTATFIRLFGKGPADWPPEDALPALSDAMSAERIDPFGLQGDSHVPAGLTYLGQFIAHDLSWNQERLDSGGDDIAGVLSHASPSLDLGVLYGDASTDVPRADDGVKLCIGTTLGGERDDLPRRVEDGLARIGDARNDENLAVAQLHVAFIKFHNAVAQYLHEIDPVFYDLATVRRVVVDAYHQIVVGDFARTLIDDYAFMPLFRDDKPRRVHARDGDPGPVFIPIEFATAGFRFGHSMVRERYQWRDGDPRTVGLAQLFEKTARNGSLRGAAPRLDGGWGIDWRRFFPLDAALRPELFNWARPIDCALSERLRMLPGGEVDAADSSAATALAFRTLARGRNLRLASGQAVARELRVRFGLRSGELPAMDRSVLQRLAGKRAQLFSVMEQHDLIDDTPLWLYVLIEAELLGNGERLGPVASRLVAEVLHAAIEAAQAKATGDVDALPRLPHRHHAGFRIEDFFGLIARYSAENSPTVQTT